MCLAAASDGLESFRDVPKVFCYHDVYWCISTYVNDCFVFFFPNGYSWFLHIGNPPWRWEKSLPRAEGTSFFQHVPFFHENLIRTYDNFLYTICMFLVFFTGPYIKAMAYQVFHIVCACIPSICSIVAETVTPFITLLQSQFPNVQALHRDMCFLHGGDDGFWGWNHGTKNVLSNTTHGGWPWW